MDCSKIEIDLLKGVKGKDIDEHLKRCEHCRSFQDSLSVFVSTEINIKRLPSEKIDTAIKEAAIKARDSFDDEDVHSLCYPSQIPIRRPRRILSYIASIACGIIIACLVVFVLESNHKHRLDNHSQSVLLHGTSVNNSGSSASLSWGDVSMDDDFLDVTTDIELNIMQLSSSTDDFSSDLK